MDAIPGTASERSSRSIGTVAAERDRGSLAAPAEILLLAIWIGLLAGFLDLGLMVFRRRLFDGDFYRLGVHFPWLIPVGVAALILPPGAMLALLALLRRGAYRPGVVAGFLAFIGFLDVCA